MNVYQKIKISAHKNLAAPAFISSQGCITYGHFLSLIALASKELHRRGVVKGDVVGITINHVIFHSAIVISLAQLGAVSLSLQSKMPALEYGNRIKRFGVRHVVRSSDIPNILNVNNIEFAKISFAEDQHAFDLAQEGLVEPETKDSARFLLTSGSTGASQAVLHTQGSWVERVARTVDEIDENSRVILPDINSTLGNVFLLGSLFAGATLIIARTDAYRELISDINAYAATHLIFPPHVLLGMMPHLPRRGMAFPTVKHLRPVGSSLSKGLLNDLLSRMSPNVYYPYGISEVGAISIATPSMLKLYPDTSGKVKSWSKAEIVDEHGKAMQSNQVGQIRVSVEGMPKEYYREPVVSKEKFRDGWFYSSDQGFINDEGYLFIQGRMDDLINIDGRKINPAQLEAQLINSSSISECAIFISEIKEKKLLFGAFVANKDQITKALSSNLQLKELIQDRYFSVDALPRNDNGKVLRRDLPSLFSKEILKKYPN